MRKQGLSFIQKLIRFLGTRNVRLQSRNLPKGMGQWRKGTVQTVKRKSTHDPLSIPTASQAMGGGRIFTPSGGGRPKFLTAGSKVGATRGTKIAGGVAGAGAVAVTAGAYESKRTPSGAATPGQRQMQAVKALKSYGSTAKSKSPISKVPKWHGDVASFSKSGYHKFKAGSKTAADFRKHFSAASKAGRKEFTWGITGKKYKVAYK